MRQRIVTDTMRFRIQGCCAVQIKRCTNDPNAHLFCTGLLRHWQQGQSEKADKVQLRFAGITALALVRVVRPVESFPGYFGKLHCGN